MRTNYPTDQIGRPMDKEAIKRQAYLDQRIAVIDLNDSRIPWEDREIIEGACRRLYGPQRRAERS
jgi:hypothetical protein